MNKIKLSFGVSAMPMYAVFIKSGRKTLEVQAFDGYITVSVQYDYARRPLSLHSECSAGDSFEVILMDHRIELYRNGELCDEDWPNGERLFSLSDNLVSDAEIRIDEYSEEPLASPSVITTFENAEGWYPGNGVFVGDCMPYRREDEYHVLYLKDRRHHGSKWGLGAHQWEHISTADFKTWAVHPMAVPISEPWEGSICTGSWIAHGKTEHLYYTVRRGRGLPAPICRSVSEDGYHFEKDRSFSFTISERYTPSSARDPKVFKDSDGLFHMLLTTRLSKEQKGCLAHLVSSDLHTWTDTGEPMLINDSAEEPECPDYIHYGEWYYLIYSLYGRARYLFSKEPFGPWQVPKEPIIPCAGVPKGAVWGERIIFTGFKEMGGYGGCMTFRAATACETGELVFKEL